MRTVNREAAVMLQRTTPSRSRVRRTPPTLFRSDPNGTEQNRTEPNASRHPPDLNNIGSHRKNLKEPESFRHAISRKTLGFRPTTITKKKLPRRLNLRQPSSPGRPARPRQPEHATALALRRQNRRPADKTTPKLTKTVHPQHAIACKTREIRQSCPPRNSFPEIPSTRESQP